MAAPRPVTPWAQQMPALMAKLEDNVGVDEEVRRYLCCVPLDGETTTDNECSLGSVYGSMVRVLKARGWKRLKRSTKQPWRADVVFGGPCASGVPWKGLRVGQVGGGRRPPLVGFYRSFESVCRKAMLVRTLRNGGGPSAAPEWLPLTFLVTPGRPEISDAQRPTLFTLARDVRGGNEERSICSLVVGEVAALEAAHEARGGDGVAHWILKPSDGGKGAGIKVMCRMDAMRTFLDGLEPGSIAWVVSEYLAAPFLLEPGRRKFDVRVWVVVDAEFRVHVWRKGVLRTCSVPFTLSPESLDDDFVHLSNHCIQTRSDSYGAHESDTNEVWLDDFDAYLAKTRPDASVEGTLAPQWRQIIRHVLDCAKESMAIVDDYEPFRCFQVFGFDFMIDDAMKVWLIEVNSSPAIAEDLADDFGKELVDLAVDAYIKKTDAEALPETNFVLVD